MRHPPKRSIPQRSTSSPATLADMASHCSSTTTETSTIAVTTLQRAATSAERRIPPLPSLQRNGSSQRRSFPLRRNNSGISCPFADNNAGSHHSTDSSSTSPPLPRRSLRRTTSKRYNHAPPVVPPSRHPTTNEMATSSSSSLPNSPLALLVSASQYNHHYPSRSSSSFQNIVNRPMICFFCLLFCFNMFYLQPAIQPVASVVVGKHPLMVDKRSTMLQDFRQQPGASANSIGSSSSSTALYTMQQALTDHGSSGNTNDPTKSSMNLSLDDESSSSNNINHHDHLSNNITISALAQPTLSCRDYGGPYDDDHKSDRVLSSLVYWRNIPADQTYSSPHRHHSDDPTIVNAQAQEQYLTFEPDEAGFNNQRMAFETTVALAWLTGRTVVLPPKVGMVNLVDHKKRQQRQASFGFADFFDLEALQMAGVKLIAFEDFLKSVALQGHLLDYQTGQPSFPPGNRTNWDSIKVSKKMYKKNSQERAVWDWLRSTTRVLDWDYRTCVAAIPTEPGPAGVKALQQALAQIAHDDAVRYAQDPTASKDEWRARWKLFRGNPTAVDASLKDRLAEILADRKAICIYDESYQQTQVLHITGEEKSGSRLLVHYYAFLFPQDWRDNLRMMRFIRDQFRYKNEIQCAAARIVNALRLEQQQEQQQLAGTSPGFYSMHVRRGDFANAYPSVFLNMEDTYKQNLRLFFSEGRTIYIATDEKNKRHFDLLRKHYKVKFLGDYEHLLTDVDPAYYGMIEQLVTAAASRFFGTYYSTFSGYILRLRGYYSQRDHSEGWQDGLLDSYYLCETNPCAFRKIMQRQYISVKPAFWEHEFPVAWRDMDHNVVPLAASSE